MQLGLLGLFLTICCKELKVSVFPAAASLQTGSTTGFRILHLALLTPETRHLEPKQIISVFAALQGPLFPGVVSDKA
jgi:hypothetical protein